MEATVIALTGVKIGAPLTRFRVGATVPFWCLGLPDVSPVVLGTVTDPPIQFRWLVDDKLLADLTGVYHPLGETLKLEFFRMVGNVLNGLQE